VRCAVLLLDVRAVFREIYVFVSLLCMSILCMYVNFFVTLPPGISPIAVNNNNNNYYNDLVFKK
jgi:hypothetical protein